MALDEWDELVPITHEKWSGRFLLADDWSPTLTNCSIQPVPWTCVNNWVSDEQLISSMTFNSILGVSCFFLFGLLQSKFVMYRIRERLPQVSVKPPRLPNQGMQIFWKWIYNVIFTSDQDLLASSGLDALVLVKTMGFCVQLFLPLTIIAAVLLPLHESNEFIQLTAAKKRLERNTTIPTGKFMNMTAANIPDGSKTFWVHFTCVYLFIGYALLLLFFYQKRFVRLRHHYLTAGDDPNLWRRKYQGVESSETLNVQSQSRGVVVGSSATRKQVKLSQSDIVTTFREQSVPDKLRMLIKAFTGIGKDEYLEANLKRPDGLMAKAAATTEQLNEEVINSLKRKSSLGTPRGRDQPPQRVPAQGPPSPAHITKINEIEVDIPHEVEGAPIESPFKNQTPEGPSTGSSSSPDPDFKFANLKVSIPELFKRVSTKTKEMDPVVYKWWDIEYEGPETDDEDMSPTLYGNHRAVLSARPSIRYLKTVNTVEPDTGVPVAVNAQQYCVLITDVPDLESLEQKRKKRRKVWEFLWKWVGGGISLADFHPSKSKRPSQIRTRGLDGTNLERSGILTLSRTMVDPLLEGNPQNKDNSNGTDSGSEGKTGSKWSRIADKITSEEIFHLEEALVEDSFKVLFPYDFVRAVPIRVHKTVDDLLEKWDHHAAKLERAEEYFTRTGERPMTRRWKWWSFLTLFLSGCSCEDPVDEINYRKCQIRLLEEKITEERKRIMRGKPSSSWLLIFKTQHAATVCAQTLLHSESSHTFQAHPAPGPEEMNWQALWRTWQEKDIRAVLVFPVLFALLVLPVGLFVGSLSRFDDFICADTQKSWYWKNYCISNHGDAGEKSFFRNTLTGWLPAILVSVWQNLIMPNGLYYLMQAKSHCISLSQLDREIASHFFYWDVFNIFIGAMLGGSIFGSLSTAVVKYQEIPSQLGNALSGSANFFVNYIILRAFFLVPYQLLVPHPGVWAWLTQLGGRCGCVRTKRDKAMLYKPASIRYGREYGIVLLIILIGLVYSVVAPIIVPITLLFFVLSWLTWRYQVLYVYVRKYESGGRMWPIVFNRVLYCLWLFQFFTSCVLVTKKALYQAGIMWVTVPIILLKFSSYCNDRFTAGMKYIPLEMAFHAAPAAVDPKVYYPPALVKGCAGWHPEYMKAWEGWGAPAYAALGFSSS